jgi:hypothetical protein
MARSRQSGGIVAQHRTTTPQGDGAGHAPLQLRIRTTRPPDQRPLLICNSRPSLHDHHFLAHRNGCSSRTYRALGRVPPAAPHHVRKGARGAPSAPRGRPRKGRPTPPKATPTHVRASGTSAEKKGRGDPRAPSGAPGRGLRRLGADTYAVAPSPSFSSSAGLRTLRIT